MKKEYDFSTAKRGPVLPVTGKTRVTMYLDDSVIAQFRALAEKTGKGYQTLINEALRQKPSEQNEALTAEIMRKILREELSHN